MTTMPTADMTHSRSTSAVFFPQLAAGGGYTTSLYLINTSAAVQTGTLRAFDDSGLPLEVRMTDGATGTSFAYSIPVDGGQVFQIDASTGVKVGWIELVPAAGQPAPIGVGLFEFSRDGVLVTQSGIPSATPTTRSRIYVDMSGDHDTGLALANPGETSAQITLRVFELDGSAAPFGSASVSLAGRGHWAKFVREQIPALPEDFRGVIELSSNSPFVALTIRSLVNARGDFLLTTFPVADLATSPIVPIIFPQIADRGGYRTEFILLGLGEAALSLDFLTSDGDPLAVGQ